MAKNTITYFLSSFSRTEDNKKLQNCSISARNLELHAKWILYITLGKNFRKQGSRRVIIGISYLQVNIGTFFSLQRNRFEIFNRFFDSIRQSVCTLSKLSHLQVIYQHRVIYSLSIILYTRNILPATPTTCHVGTSDINRSKTK